MRPRRGFDVGTCAAEGRLSLSISGHFASMTTLKILTFQPAALYPVRKRALMGVRYRRSQQLGGLKQTGLFPCTTSRTPEADR
jgi:hypothetical protein